MKTKTLKWLSLIVIAVLSMGFASCGDESDSDSDSDSSSISGSINGYDYVDLGLSVKWATCNVGASSPEDYGDYYAWGETEIKSEYTETNYKHYNKSLKKYNYIGSDISGTNYDVAYVKWGNSWRMPTLDEFKELINECTWKSTIHNGIKCQCVTGPNGKSIYIPGYDFYNEGSPSVGQYWTATFSERWEHEAYYIYSVIGGTQAVFGSSRYKGFPVRPVTE